MSFNNVHPIWTNELKCPFMVPDTEAVSPKIQSIGTALIRGKNQSQIGKRDFRMVLGPCILV
jgi:hypothetical protein